MKTQYAHTMVLSRIGFNISRLRAEREMSQSTLAYLATVDRSHLNQVENGNNNASIIFLAKIADSLNVPITAFFEGLDHLPPCEIYGRKPAEGEKGKFLELEDESIEEAPAENPVDIQYETLRIDAE